MSYFLEITLLNFVIFSARYFIIAGLAFVIFYIWKKRELLNRKIQKIFPKNSDYAREVSYSCISLGIFALVGGVFIGTSLRETTQIYVSLSEYSAWYFFLSIFLLIIDHDAYFYWTHRWLHNPWMMRYIHRIHHLSHNPSPWTAFSFHPLEAFVTAGVLITAVYILPVHPITILIYGTWMTAYNVLGHLGYDIFPANAHKHWFWKWWNSPRDHNLHHEKWLWNYWLYWNIWDKVMGTYRK